MKAEYNEATGNESAVTAVSKVWWQLSAEMRAALSLAIKAAMFVVALWGVNQSTVGRIEARIDHGIAQVRAEMAEVAKQAHTRMDRMDDQMDRRMGRLEDGQGRLEDKVTRVEQRLTQVENKVDRLDHRVGRLEARVDRIEDKVDRIEDKVDRIETHLMQISSRLTAESRQVEPLPVLGASDLGESSDVSVPGEPTSRLVGAEQ